MALTLVMASIIDLINIYYTAGLVRLYILQSKVKKRKGRINQVGWVNIEI